MIKQFIVEIEKPTNFCFDRVSLGALVLSKSFIYITFNISAMGLVAMRLVGQAATAIHLYFLYLNLVRGLALDYELYAKGVNE